VPHGIWWSRIGIVVVGAGRDRAGDERVRVIHEHLDPHGPGPGGGRGVPLVVVRLAEEERRSLDRQPDHAAEIPQHGRPQRLAVPPGGRAGVGHRQHH
jgi:hypothetical protein